MDVYANEWIIERFGRDIAGKTYSLLLPGFYSTSRSRNEIFWKD